MKRHLLTAVLALVLGVLGFAVSGVALATNGNGNGGTPRGGDNPCQPGYHGVYDEDHHFVGCEHNGDGSGNCGQNQSDNGGDHGYGNDDECTTETTPPPPCDDDDDNDCSTTTPTDTTPTETTPTETTPTETTPTESTPTDTTPTDTTPKPHGGPVCPDGGPNNSGKDGQPGNDSCARSETNPPQTTPAETTPAGTAPAETTPAETTPPETTSDQSTTPSIVGQPPKAQHNPAHVKQSPAHSAVAGRTTKSEPKPTHKPQPAPFTL